MSGEDVVTTEATSFSSGGTDVTVTEDVYSGGIAGFNTDAFSGGGGLSGLAGSVPGVDSPLSDIPGSDLIKAAKEQSDSIGESVISGLPTIDPALANVGAMTKSGMSMEMACAASYDFEYVSELAASGETLASKAKETSSFMPRGMTMAKLSKDLHFKQIASVLPRVYSSIKSGDLNSLTAEGLSTIIGDTDSLTARVLAGDSSLSLNDLKDANGTDYAVLGAVAIYGIASVMGKNDGSDIFDILEKTGIPIMFRESALGMLIDKAAEYGLGDVVSGLFDVLNERYFAKPKENIRSLLKGFRFKNKVIVSQVTKSEKGLVTSIGEALGLSEDNSSLITDIIIDELAPDKVLDKRDQAKRLIDNLYKIDKHWLDGNRGPDASYKLDILEAASKDAIVALTMDERTLIPASVKLTFKLKKSPWRSIMRVWHKDVYIV